VHPEICDSTFADNLAESYIYTIAEFKIFLQKFEKLMWNINI